MSSTSDSEPSSVNSAESMMDRQPKDFRAPSHPTLHRELQAAKLLVEQLKTTEALDSEEDADLLADMVEGETNLFGAIDAVIQKIHADLALVDAMKIQEDQLSARRKRFEERNQRRKWAIENALIAVGKPRHRNPLCDISTRKAARSLEITDESAIPGSYWISGEPKLDKRLLLSDLKDAVSDGQEIEGVKLSEERTIKAWSWK